MFRWKNRKMPTREMIAAIADTAMVSFTGVLCIGFVLAVGLNAAGLLYSQVYDPLVEAVHATPGEIRTAGVAVLQDVAALHVVISSVLLAASGIAFAVMVLAIFAKAADIRRWHSIALTSVLFLSMSTPLPKLLLVAWLSHMPMLQDMPGALEMATDAVWVPSETTTPGLNFDVLFFIMSMPLVWYRFAIEYPGLPGARFLPKALKPAPVV